MNWEGSCSKVWLNFNEIFVFNYSFINHNWKYTRERVRFFNKFFRLHIIDRRKIIFAHKENKTHKSFIINEFASLVQAKERGRAEEVEEKQQAFNILKKLSTSSLFYIIKKFVDFNISILISFCSVSSKN